MVPPVVPGAVDLGEGEHFAGLESRHGDLALVDQHDDAGVFLNHFHSEVVELTRATQRDFSVLRDSVNSHSVVLSHAMGG